MLRWSGRETKRKGGRAQYNLLSAEGGRGEREQAVGEAKSYLERD